MKTNLKEPNDTPETQTGKAVAGCLMLIVSLSVLGYAIYTLCSL